MGCSASVLLLCGLPGSGKSTLASSVVEHYTEESSMFINVKYIEYDSIASNLCEEYGDDGDISTTRARTSTSTNSAQIDDLENERQENTTRSTSSNAFTDQDLKAWRETRNVALHLLEIELSSALENALGRERSGKVICHDPHRVLIIMDDNFHLRSMRRDVYKKCQEFIVQSTPSTCSNANSLSIGLSTVFVNTPFDDCIANNEKRLGTPQYIPPITITAMKNTLEPPDSEKTNFENYFIDTLEWNVSTNAFYQRLDECLFSSVLKHPIEPPPPAKSLEQLEKERLATLQSRLHRVDLVLRSLVGATCRTNKTFAKSANEARKRILQECKDKCNVVDDDMLIAQRFNNIVLQHAGSNECEKIRLAIHETIHSLRESAKDTINGH